MAKQLKFDVQARESLKNGLDVLADAVKVTLGINLCIMCIGFNEFSSRGNFISH